MNQLKYNNFIPELGLSLGDMMHGIKYSKLIQDSILCTRQNVRDIFGDFCIVYQPKNIISGDFYFCHQKENLKYLAVCDCTGHSFSGAMLTILGHNILKCALAKYTDLNDIFTFLNNNILETFNEGSAIVNQGMDVGMICLDESTNTLLYSGAHRPLYVLSDGELTVIKTIRKSIGTDSNNIWSKSEIKVKKGDKLFMFTDGFVDQFDEHYMSKFGAKRLMNILKMNASRSIDKIQEILQQEFDSHKKDQVFTDDVLLVGIEI